MYIHELHSMQVHFITGNSTGSSTLKLWFSLRSLVCLQYRPTQAVNINKAQHIMNISTCMYDTYTHTHRAILWPWDQKCGESQQYSRHLTKGEKPQAANGLLNISTNTAIIIALKWKCCAGKNKEQASKITVDCIWWHYTWATQYISVAVSLTNVLLLS